MILLRERIPHVKIDKCRCKYCENRENTYFLFSAYNLLICHFVRIGSKGRGVSISWWQFFSIMAPAKRIGRGKKSFEKDRFASVQSHSLRSEQSMCVIASSASSKKNANRARAVLHQYCKRISSPTNEIQDPRTVSPESSRIVMNLLYDYCKMNSPEALSNDSVAAMVQGLRTVYEEAGHRGRWTVDERSSTAKGNPCTGNDDIIKLRAAHRVHLSQIDRSKLRARPLQIALVCEHAKQFWFGHGGHVDYRDVLLNAIMIIGLNMGLRFDEVRKLNIGHVTVHTGTSGTGSIVMSITTATKNSTKPKDYVLREWPGNPTLRSSILVDPCVALLSWMCIRGNRPGYLFCAVNEKNMIASEKAWSAKQFTDFLCIRLRMCGVGSHDLEMYSGHSIKRGSVQLYRSFRSEERRCRERV